MKRTLCLILVTILALCFMPSCKKSTTDNSEPIPTTIGIGVGTIATNFVENDPAELAYALESYKGKVILISFGAVWCPPCRAEAPHLVELHNSYQGRGLVIIQIIHQDLEGNPAGPDDLNGWINTYGLPFPVLSDPDYSTVTAYGINALPTNIVIDRDFAIRYRGEGYDASAVQTAIDKYL